MGKSKQAKKNESKALGIAHPNSRKATKLAKQAVRQLARLKTKKDFSIRKNIFGEKLMWFKDHLPSGVTVMTANCFEKLFDSYLARFNEELEQIEIKHSIGNRKGRQHASREDTIKMTVSREKEEFETCGLEMVDILNPKQLEMLKEWEGEIGKMNNFVIKRFTRNYLKTYKPLPISKKYLRQNSENEGNIEDSQEKEMDTNN
ncbi:translation machinery-associated protein 16 homolog [Cimex lectularius]|uniref:Translation machinery-associated protein 16 n=1 Tax=Cimex lectularius TaxID=79782 RepID=A0A8I6SA40_CIMLE|nr:translation machinery-associated protein 16 homolog [Cimex lectularius]